MTFNFDHLFTASNCPIENPFAFDDGKYCCSTAIENYSEEFGDECDAGLLSVKSKCCKENDFIQCPEKSCSNCKGTIQFCMEMILLIKLLIKFFDNL